MTYCRAFTVDIVAADLQPGMVWCGMSSNPDCRITEIVGRDALDDGTPMVRFAGILGNRKRPLTWHFRADQRMEIHRG